MRSMVEGSVSQVCANYPSTPPHLAMGRIGIAPPAFPPHP